MRLWVQLWEESERGWGVRPNGFTLHVKREHIEQYLARMRSEEAKGQPPGYIPHEYSRPVGEPYEADELDEAAVAEVMASDLGKMFLGVPPSTAPVPAPAPTIPPERPEQTFIAARLRGRGVEILGPVKARTIAEATVEAQRRWPDCGVMPARAASPDQREQALQTRRRCAYTVVVLGQGFVLAVATEGVPGYAFVGSVASLSYKEVRDHAQALNESLGLDPREALSIVASARGK